MPVARVQTPDGRIVRVQVPEGTAEQEIIDFVAEQAEGGLQRPDEKPLPGPTSDLTDELRQGQQQADRADLEHQEPLTGREQVQAEQTVNRLAQRPAAGHTAGPMAEPRSVPTMADRVLNIMSGQDSPLSIYKPPPEMLQGAVDKLLGRRGAVTPESEAEAIIAEAARREGMTPKEYREKVGPRTGPLERGAKDFASGAVGAGAGILGYIERFTGPGGTTEDLRERAEVTAQELMPADPNFVDQLISGFGSTAAFYVPGVGLMAGAKAVYNLAPRMALWLGSGGSAGLEAATESGQVYREAIQSGKSPQEAAALADKAFFANTALVSWTNRLGLFGDQGGRLLRRSLGATMEGTQELGQQAISNAAAGRPLLEGGLESFSIGAIVGGTLGGAIDTPTESFAREFDREVSRGSFDAERDARARLDPETAQMSAVPPETPTTPEAAPPQPSQPVDSERPSEAAPGAAPTEPAPPVTSNPPTPDEQATTENVEDSAREIAAGGPADIVAAREWLVGEIDKALKTAPSEGAVGPSRARDSRESGIGYVTFEVPGDGTFKVLNTREVLESFKRKVNRAPGFKKPGKKKPAAGPRSRGTVGMAAPGQGEVDMQPGENYRGFRQTTFDEQGQPEKIKFDNPLRRQEIIKQFAKDVGQRFQLGRMGRKRALGYYAPYLDTVRIKHMNDMEVVSHEVAHYIDDMVWNGFGGRRGEKNTRPWLKGPKAKTYSKELRGLSYDKNKVYEGFAEFVRHWMTQPEYAQEQAPEFYEFWEDFVEGDGQFGPGLKRAKRNMLAWFDQPAVERAFSKIGGEPAAAINDAHDTMWDRSRASIFDDLHGLYRWETQGSDRKTPYPLGPYEVARLSRAAYSIVDGAMRFGAPRRMENGRWTYVDRNNNPVSLIDERGRIKANPKYERWGLSSILDQVGGELDAWAGYAVGRAADELHLQGRERLFKRDEIDALLHLGVGKPHFTKAFEDYQVWNNQVLDFAEQMGVIDPTARKGWRRLQYLPFHRLGDPRGTKRSKGVEGNVRIIKRLTGGTENLRPVLENMINNAAMLITEGIKNDVRRTTVDFMRDHRGLGRSLERIPKDSKRIGIDRDQVIDEFLRGLGIESPGKYRRAREKGLVQDERIDELLDVLEENFEDFLTFYMHGQAPQGAQVFAVLRGGKPEFYEVDDTMLWRAIASLNRRGPRTEIGRFFNQIRRVGQAGVTLTIDFMTANLWRDTLHGWAFSKHGFRPVLDSISGLKSRALRDPAYAEFIANGGGMASYLVDDRALRNHIQHFYTKKKIDFTWVLHSPAKALLGLELLADSAEMSTRIGEFKRALRKGEKPREAAYSAREVSVDFAMRGDDEWVNLAYNQIIFLKAAMNGMDRFYRGLTKDQNRGAIWTKAGSMALASVGLYLLNRDNPCYQQLQDWDRDSNWLVFVPKNESPTGNCEQDYRVLRFPRIWEIGAMTAAAERTMELYLDGVSKEHGAEYAQHLGRIFFELFKVEYLPHWASPVVETYWLNRVRFTDTPIRAPAFENAEPFNQFSPYTAQTLRDLGKLTAGLPPALQLSPANMEALIRGYFNTWGMYGLMLADRMRYGKELPAMRPDEVPGWRRFLRTYPLRGTKYENEFWDLWKRARQLDETYERLKEQNEPELAEKKGRQEERTLFDMLERTRKKVNRFKDNMIKIRDSKVLSPDAKREQIDELQSAINQIYQETMEALDKEGF